MFEKSINSSKVQRPKKKKVSEKFEFAYLQELDDIAGSKDSMGNGEFEGLRRREIWGQNTLLHAPAPEDLAGGAGAEHHRGRWRRRRRRGGAAGGRRWGGVR